MIRLLLFLLVVVVAPARAATDPGAVVPATAPRTLVLASQRDAFRAYCTTGDGATAFARIRSDLDRVYLQQPLPAEPVTYGDPSPSKRTSDKADLWRAQQDITGRISAIAEAAALCWIVTGESKYFDRAREILLHTAGWHFAPDWKSGSVPGATDIHYNDEAHFRLWRKLPLVYDQLRSKLSAADRAIILAHFKQRGARSVAWIEKEGDIANIRRNSLESDLSSHPVRFMPMTGLTALALWDDLPEARQWWTLAYTFYRDQFTPWGGDDGGWGEGSAYWRGTFEHASFQDALIALGDPLAYATPFWKNSPYFALYNVQPYLHTVFGDASNAGRFNLEPATADYFEHLARVQQNGFFRSYAALSTDTRTRPIDKGLSGLDRSYPTAAEFLVRNFTVASRPLPAPRPLAELPPHRYFADVGWVSLHSALGRPDDDIQLTFRASPYGSFSHSHADQLGFILNAFGEGLAINSAYREFHNSPHHEQWTRQSRSKNVILIDGVGQKAKSKDATGKVTRFEQAGRTVWTTGDATAAYRVAQAEPGRVQRVTRDVVFVDQRYVVLRDRVSLTSPAKLTWLLHAEKNLAWNAAQSTATIRGAAGKASLTARIIAPGVTWQGQTTTEFPVPVDPKYTKSAAGSPYITGSWHNQAHLSLESDNAANEFTVYAVLWPERGAQPAAIEVTIDRAATLSVRRPDGKADTITLSDTALAVK
ncbi:heparinase II/III domain-containing protein [Horticoccus sp. 23ND18S-11]|uniref:heparinase II/III domain-containing protein n=1 Tax=Horticoccus sp. 23ND18S-11 TaxID=3391832 RepID=UPI0039C92E13